jgi:hypothetical protein
MRKYVGTGRRRRRRRHAKAEEERRAGSRPANLRSPRLFLPFRGCLLPPRGCRLIVLLEPCCSARAYPPTPAGSTPRRSGPSIVLVVCASLCPRWGRSLASQTGFRVCVGARRARRYLRGAAAADAAVFSVPCSARLLVLLSLSIRLWRPPFTTRIHTFCIHLHASTHSFRTISLTSIPLS